MFEVYDLAESIAFYRDVLGFEVIAEYRVMWCRMRSGDVDIMLNTAYEPGEKPPQREPERIRGHRDASLRLSVASPDDVYARLREHGREATPPEETAYGIRLVSAYDPNGFAIRFTCPAGAS